MTVTLSIPDPLQAHVDYHEQIHLDGNKEVGELLFHLVNRFPQLKQHIYDADGNLRSNISLRLGSEDINDQNGQKTIVEDGAELAILCNITNE